jgi:membrane protein
MQGDSWWAIVKGTFSDFFEDKAMRLAAALAYYAIFSIAPLLVIALAVAGMAFDPQKAQGELNTQLKGAMGEKGADAVQSMVESANANRNGGILAATLGGLALLFGASGIFTQLKDAMDTIWKVKPKEGQGIWGIIWDRVLAFLMVAVIAILLLALLVASAMISGMADRLPIPSAWARVADWLASIAIVTLLFMVVFKYLPDAEIAWSDVWLGALVTALLFTAGKFALGIYLGRAAVASSYGAAGSLVVVLLWIYYSSLLLLLGAEFAKVYAQRRGSGLKPEKTAERTT